MVAIPELRICTDTGEVRVERWQGIWRKRENVMQQAFKVDSSCTAQSVSLPLRSSILERPYFGGRSARDNRMERKIWTSFSHTCILPYTSSQHLRKNCDQCISKSAKKHNINSLVQFPPCTLGLPVSHGVGLTSGEAVTPQTKILGNAPVKPCCRGKGLIIWFKESTLSINTKTSNMMTPWARITPPHAHRLTHGSMFI